MLQVSIQGINMLLKLKYSLQIERPGSSSAEVDDAGKAMPVQARLSFEVLST